MNQAIDVFRPVPSLDRSFLAFWLLSDQLLNWAVTRSKATAGQSNLTLQICRDLPIPLCSLEEQKEIVRDIESAFERIENLAAQAVRASDLLDRLDQATLDKVFRGEILVSDKESDEA
jgi:type I restriction enzyme S subunit